MNLPENMTQDKDKTDTLVLFGHCKICNIIELWYVTINELPVEKRESPPQ